MNWIGYLLIAGGLAMMFIPSPAYAHNEPFEGFALFVSARIGADVQLAGWLYLFWRRVKRLEDALKLHDNITTAQIGFNSEVIKAKAQEIDWLRK